MTRKQIETMKPKIITIVGRRWFNKGPGNTYHSVTAYVDGIAEIHIDFAYGYGDQYVHTAWRALLEKGIVNPKQYDNGSTEPPWRYCETNGIAYATEAVDVAKKKDL